MLWLPFGRDFSLLDFALWLLPWLPRYVSNVKIFSKSPCTRRFPTNRSVIAKKIKLGNFLQKNSNPSLCNYNGSFDLLFDCLLTVFIFILCYKSIGNRKDTVKRVSRLKSVKTVRKHLAWESLSHKFQASMKGYKKGVKNLLRT